MAEPIDRNPDRGAERDPGHGGDRGVEQLLRAVVDAAPSGLLLVDARGTIILVNREIERMFGYGREELSGQPVEKLVPERFRPDHGGHLAGFLREPRIRTLGVGRDLFGRRNDGSELPIEIGLTPVATTSGFFVLAAIADITARKRAEERFRIAVESSPNGMVMSDSAGRIILVNREVERMFGYSREELLGQAIEILVPQKSRASHPDFRRQFFADPTTRAMGVGRDLNGVRKDGTEIPVEIGLNPIHTDEGLVVLSSIVDISRRRHLEGERHALEEQLRQSQKMEALGTLAGGIAHDFNNILAAIFGYTELARTRSKDAGLRSDLAEILVAAGRGRDLVGRILMFSRRQELELKPIDLATAVADAVQLLRPTLPSSIDLRLALPSTPLPVVGDLVSVQQVVMNLATNAAQAMPDGGTLEIQLEKTYVRDSVARAHPELHEGEHALLTVRDTGQGIAPHLLSRVFEPFFTTKPQGKGTGLGLATVHTIMVKHSGVVDLSSEVGVGTTARCYFPAEEKTEPEGVVVADEEAIGRGEHVLFVDDEPVLVRAWRRHLELLGFRVTAIEGPRKALAVFEAAPHDFDVIVVDRMMPEMDGLQFSKKVKALRGDVPVLMMSGFVDDLSPERRTEAGLGALLLKPVLAQDLAQSLRKLLDEE